MPTLPLLRLKGRSRRCGATFLALNTAGNPAVLTNFRHSHEAGVTGSCSAAGEIAPPVLV
jgi:hypothetical protein